jgi:hypothetical protein
MLMMCWKTVFTSLLTLFVAYASACSIERSSEQGIITLNPAITYQTMTGWEATAQAGQVDEFRWARLSRALC